MLIHEDKLTSTTIVPKTKRYSRLSINVTQSRTKLLEQKSSNAFLSAIKKFRYYQPYHCYKSCSRLTFDIDLVPK